MKELIYLAITAIPSVCSCAVSIVHMVITYRKSKQPPKDAIWETALQIEMKRSDGYFDADEFARTYESLKSFRDNGCALNGKQTIYEAVKEKESKGQSQQLRS